MIKTITTRGIATLTSIFVMAIAILLIAGWPFHIPALTTSVALNETHFNTAVCFLLSAITLFLLNDPGISKRKLLIAHILAVIVLLIATITLSEYIFKWDAGIDQLFHKASAFSSSEKYPGRMDQMVASLFILLSIVFLLLRKKRFHLLIQIILLSGLAFLVLLFFVYVTLQPYPNAWMFLIVFHTSFLFIALYAGSFFSYPLSHLRFPLQKKIAGYFILVVLVMAVVFLSIRKNNQSFSGTSQAMEGSFKVLLQNRDIENLAQHVETNTRGFIISGKGIFLEKFNEAAPALQQSVDQLGKLLSNNLVQKAHVDTLKNLVADNIQIRKQLIDLRSTKGFDTANQLFETEISKQKMDQLRAVVANIETTELQLLMKRKAAYEKGIQTSNRVINFFYFITILLLLLSFYIIYRNTRARNKAEEEIKNLNATLEKRVEEKSNLVIEKEKQYRFLIENMREGIQLVSYDWRYLLVNSSLIYQSKYSNEHELLGATMMEKYPGIENTQLFKVLQRCMNERESRILDNEFIYPDGSKAWMELSIQPAPEGLFILSMDITERKKAEHEKNRLLHTLQKSLNEIYTFDQETLLLEYVNEGALRNLGYTEEELYQLTALDIKPDLNPLSFEKLVRPLISGAKEKIVFETRHKRKDGSIYPAESHLQLIKQEDKNSFLAIVLNITERKQAELIKKQLNDNLQKKAAELMASNSELERFAYVASHDLQEPLRMVTSFLGLLKNKLGNSLDETNQRYLHFAVDGAERMKKLIHDLLEYSRLGSAKETFSRVDCNEVVNNVRSMLQLKITEEKATLNLKPLPVIQAIQPQMQQLFLNLMGNALKYRNSKPLNIEVGCEDREELWQFYVKDNGMGIDPKFFNKIFIIFQRLHNKSEYSGTGIGLSVCKKIVKQHGGNIWVESAPGKGSTFYFTIPKR